MKIKLGDLDIEFISGQIQSRVEYKGEGDNVKKILSIVPKAIENGYLDHDNLSSFNVLETTNNIRLSEKGDIILKVTTPFDACLINENDEGLFIPSFCMKLKIKDKRINPYYLLAFINSSSFYNVAKSSSVGVAISIINISKVKEIEIPLISLEEQEIIANKYKCSIEKIKTMKEIVSLEHEYYNSCFKELEEN